jgi:phospholipid/cholesterol/gamma-HCH transport system substrate-binding protein
MSEQRMRFWIGLFVLAACLLLGVLVTLFGSMPTLFTAHSNYTAVFSDATGLRVGTPVRRSGVRIGSVQRITLDDDTGEVRVEMAIERPHTLVRGEQPTIVQGLIGSDAAVDLLPVRRDDQPPDRTPQPQDELMAGTRQPGVSTLVDRASQVMPTTEQTLRDLQRALQRIEKMAPDIEQAMRAGRDLARAGTDAMPELRKTSDEVRELARSTRELLPPIRKASEELQIMAQALTRAGDRADKLLTKNEADLTRAIENLNSTLTRMGRALDDENLRNLAATFKNLSVATELLAIVLRTGEELIKDARQVVQRLNPSIDRLDDVLCNMQMATQPFALRSAAIVKNLDEGTEQLTRTLTETRELLALFARADGTLRRVIEDPGLYNHLDETVLGLGRLTPRLERILRDVEVFADKIARHPEALGISGAVKPSTGIK